MAKNDFKSLENLYDLITEKKKSHEYDHNERSKKSKPDYLDVDNDGNTKESFKKALKDKENLKESSKFKSLYLSIFAESQEVVCGTKINPGAQYHCTMKDGEEKVLKGESVILMKDKCKSVKPAHKK